MKRTRLLVADDIYMMSRFATCEADSTDHRGADEQVAWLKQELDAARQKQQQVWILGHLPPSVNPQSSLGKNGVCSGGNAEMYLSSTKMADAITSHADIVRLGIFGHTHMDELHVLGEKGAAVPIKIVASISPVSGNLPSFTLGKVAPATATLMDYTVYEASNFTGVGTQWTLEYDFDKTYGESSFTAKALEDVAGRLHADPAGTSAESRAYMAHYFKGQTESELARYWPGYVCSLDRNTPEAFRKCACTGK